MILRELAFNVIKFYGRNFPVRYGKWKLIVFLLERAGISPYTTSNWGKLKASRAKMQITSLEGVKIYNSPTKNLSIYMTKSYEPYLIRALNQILKPGNVFFDVGANVGIISLIAAKILQSGQVYSFEPIKSTYDEMQKNIDLNRELASGLISTQQIALSDVNETRKIKIPLENGQLVSGQATFSDEMTAKNWGGNYIEEEVQTIKLDSLKLPKANVIKIDVEGHEMEFINGAKTYLQKHMPTLLLEVNSGMNYSVDDMKEVLEAIGYREFIVLGRRKEQLTTKHEGISGLNVMVAK